MRARVITGAIITSDDMNVQFHYRPKCPRCGQLTEGEATGTAMFGSVFTEQSYCPKCGPFEVKITRD